MQSTNEFNTMLKGLADKNTEKEKETKVQCETWLVDKLAKKDEKGLEGFFEYLMTAVNGVMANGAMNALGIFAYSLKNSERLKEHYIPKILETLINSYFQNETNPKMKENSSLQNKKIITSNLLSVIVVAQYLVFPQLHRLMEILFRMKKDQTDETVAFSKTIDDSLYPIIKDDRYKVSAAHARISTRTST